MRNIKYAISAIIISAALIVGVTRLISPSTSYRPALMATLDSRPDCIVDVHDPSLDMFVNAWQMEVQRRFHNSIVLLCHGGGDVDGVWLMLDHGVPRIAQDVIREEQAKYPNRILVILACNPGHLKLTGLPRVYYSTASTWCEPDRSLTGGSLDRMTLDGEEVPMRNTETRWQSDPDVTGNIFEMVEAN